MRIKCATQKTLPGMYAYNGKPEDFYVEIAQEQTEIKGLLEVGFRYACEREMILPSSESENDPYKKLRVGVKL